MAACTSHKAPTTGQARRDYLAGYTAAENGASDRHHAV